MCNCEVNKFNPNNRDIEQRLTCREQQMCILRIRWDVADMRIRNAYDLAMKHGCPGFAANAMLDLAKNVRNIPIEVYIQRYYQITKLMTVLRVPIAVKYEDLLAIETYRRKWNNL